MAIMQPNSLIDFCDAESARPLVNAPFVYRNWQYATDCKIVVRRPTSGGDTRFDPIDLSRDLRRSAEAAFDGFPACDQPFPAHDGTTREVKCQRCVGGKKMVECGKCDGDGGWTCEECDAEHECEECDGKGRVPSAENCEQCGGTEVVHAPAPQRICGLTIAGQYVEQIAALGEVRCAPQGERQRLAFVCGDLQGLVMEIIG